MDDEQLSELLSAFKDLRPATLKGYKNTLTSLYRHKPSDLDLFNDVDGTMKFLKEHKWNPSLKPSSLASTINISMAINRNKPIHKELHTFYNELKASNNEAQIQQIASDKESAALKLSIPKLQKLVKDKYIEDCTDDRYYTMIGFIQTDACLRNELKNIRYSEVYLDYDEYPTTNFIWCANKRFKLLEIRENKVRNTATPPWQYELSSKTSTAINNYLEFSPLNHLDYIADRQGKKALETSTITRIINKVFEPLYVSANTIRKIYANDVRKKSKGKMTDEMVACSKLDHSLQEHNKHYIKY